MRGEPDAGDGRVLRQCVLLLLVTFLGANKYMCLVTLKKKNSFRVLEFLTPLLYLEYYGFKVHAGSFQQV